MGRYFKKWVKDRTPAFWICIIVMLLSIAGAVYYIMTINGLEGPSGPVDLMQWGTVWCAVAGAAAFIILSLFNLANYGAAAMGILDLVAFCLMLSPDVVSYVGSNMMGSYSDNLLALPGLMDIIISAILLVAAAILSNVFAWIHLNKRPKEEKKKKTKKANGSQPGSDTPSSGLAKKPATVPSDDPFGPYVDPRRGSYGSPYGQSYGNPYDPYGSSYNDPYGPYGDPYGSSGRDPYNEWK